MAAAPLHTAPWVEHCPRSVPPKDSLGDEGQQGAVAETVSTCDKEGPRLLLNKHSLPDRTGTVRRQAPSSSTRAPRAAAQGSGLGTHGGASWTYRPLRAISHAGKPQRRPREGRGTVGFRGLRRHTLFQEPERSPDPAGTAPSTPPGCRRSLGLGAGSTWVGRQRRLPATGSPDGSDGKPAPVLLGGGSSRWSRFPVSWKQQWLFVKATVWLFSSSSLLAGC